LLFFNRPGRREAATGHDLPYAACSISSQPVKASRNLSRRSAKREAEEDWGERRR
jgi:hypothetical protein